MVPSNARGGKDEEDSPIGSDPGGDSCRTGNVCIGSARCRRRRGSQGAGPSKSYKSVAAKYKGKASAEARLIEHITSGEKAKFPDGHEEEHKIVKTTPPKDMEQIKNLVAWILSQ
jgi:hypothetical protein